MGPRAEDVAAAVATLKANEAALALARKQLADATLYAPADGVIQDRILEPGDMASPQLPVFTLALTDPVWVRAYVQGPDLGKIHHGMNAEVTTDSYPGKRYRAWIGFISPTAEFTPKSVETTEVRTKLVYQVRVFVRNPQDELRLGMPATVTIPLDQPQPGRCGNARPGQIALMPRRHAAQQSSRQHPRARRTIRVQFAGPQAISRRTARRFTALRGVSFRVRHGTVTGLIGPDGAGKTTLMRLAVGLLAPDARPASPRWASTPPPVAGGAGAVGYMPQRFGLYEDLTVQENLDLYADLQGVAANERAGPLRGTDADDRTGPVHAAAGRAGSPAA